VTKKRKVDVKDIDDAIDRLTEPHAGDQIMVRALPITVPSPSYDIAIINASMQLLLNSFNDDPDVTKKHSFTLCEEGAYEVVAVFHLRRVGDYEAPLLN
jgi:hypothetical protein